MTATDTGQLPDGPRREFRVRAGRFELVADQTNTAARANKGRGLRRDRPRRAGSALRRSGRRGRARDPPRRGPGGLAAGRRRGRRAPGRARRRARRRGHDRVPHGDLGAGARPPPGPSPRPPERGTRRRARHRPAGSPPTPPGTASENRFALPLPWIHPRHGFVRDLQGFSANVTAFPGTSAAILMSTLEVHPEPPWKASSQSKRPGISVSALAPERVRPNSRTNEKKEKPKRG